MEIKMIDLPDNGILLYESKHKDGHVVKEHRHLIHQILYVIDGNGILILDGKRTELRQDRLVLIMPHSDHAIIAEAKLTILVLAFHAEVLDPVIQDEIVGKRFQGSFVSSMNVFTAIEVRQLLRKMMFESGNRDQLGLLALRIYLQEILLLLSRANPGPAVTDSNGLRAERIRHYIDERYYEPLTAGELSAKMGISARYVNTIFKDYYGITPIQYLTEVRIQVAKKLLSETDKEIVTVCFEVGYENLTTFYRVFRNTVKISPHKFRKQQSSQREIEDRS